MHQGAGEDINRGSLERLLAKVMSDRGLDLGQFRARYVERRINVRLNALGLTTYRQYAAYLDAHPEEYARLLDTLTINVTQFFRDPDVYQLFRDEVLPAVVSAKQQRKQRLLRIWSAGCATGQEPYSLAMSALDAIERLDAGTMLPTVIGTDIDPVALATAKAGEYPAKEIAHIPEPDRTRYVEIDGDRMRMRQSVKDIVRFQYLNLFENPPIHGVDVVFCRNVFIYFNRSDQERLLNAFWESLTRGGYLVLGRSERLTPQVSERFVLVDSRQRIYQKPRGLQQR
jgi:chemotaxis protein methyltransferase CheR